MAVQFLKVGNKTINLSTVKYFTDLPETNTLFVEYGEGKSIQFSDTEADAVREWIQANCTDLEVG